MIDDEALKNIEKLHRLKSDGVITEDEFEKSKEKILFGAGPKKRAVAQTDTPSLDDHFAWMTLPLRRYADFEGRSGRREFWMFQLIPVGLLVVTFLVVSADTNIYDGIGALGKLTLVTCMLTLLGLFIPQMAVQVRRFHDQDKSGWFALLNLIPYLGPIVVLIFMLLEGTPGDNKFGPVPDQTLVPSQSTI